jgi:hypothetical protein
MTVWGWIAVTAGTLIGLSIVISLVIAKILGSISSGLNQMFEEESWRSAPLTRAVKAARMDERKRRSVRRAAQGWKTRR